MEGPSFQEVIARLAGYWADQGCLVTTPYHTEVGAGTFNPFTLLRSLGPDPWRVAYVEPSIRPTDGRYGENPFRLQHYFQYQVLLKPSPDDVQDLYLDSLRALGIRPEEHDIRFVEDDWEGPTLGAWGLGWEVWMDGMEMTQFTYFQQAGGIDLAPISVELTYGLERIAMYLQGVRRSTTSSGGTASPTATSTSATRPSGAGYNFEVADTEALFAAFDQHERECGRCLEEGLVLPAYDQVLKCSHAFNLLDARGVISVTERGAYIWRVRALAARCARAYLEMVTPRRGSGVPDLLIEVGCEELPSTACREIVEQAPGLVASSLAALGLEGSARRCRWRRAGSRCTRTGPARAARRPSAQGSAARRRSAAFGPDGAPTKAAQGFARGQGVAVEDLVVREQQGRAFVFAERRRGGPRPGRAGARGGRAPGRRPALLQDHALGRRHRPALLAAGSLDRGQGRRAHRALRTARPDGRGRQPGAPLPRRPGDDRLGVRLRRACAPWPWSRATTTAGPRSSPGSTRPPARWGAPGAIRAASSRRSCSWSSGRASSPGASTTGTCALPPRVLRDRDAGPPALLPAGGCGRGATCPCSCRSQQYDESR